MIQNRFKSFSENSSKKIKPKIKEAIIVNIFNSIKNCFYKYLFFKNCLQRNKKSTKIIPVCV